MAPELCTEQEISTLVHQFYDRIRDDQFLGPVFNQHITDWDTHLDSMVRFWSSLLRGTASFNGRPMPKHAALPTLTAAMFHHWLELFDLTTQELNNPEMAAKAQDFARRIARQLWMGYQITNSPDQPVSELFAPAGTASK